MTRSTGAATVCGILWAVLAAAEPFSPGEVLLEDVIEVQVLGRELVAFDATGATTRLDLDLGENVQWSESRGRVAIVLTDRRALAVASRGAGWQELRWRVSESPPERAFLGERVGLVVTDKRLLGFLAHRSGWIEQGVGPGERLDAVRVGASIGLVVTDRSAFGLSPETAGFYRLPLQVQESFEAARASDTVATVTTSKRLLVFKALSGSWSVQSRPIH
jgi:predicted RNA-binding protein